MFHKEKETYVHRCKNKKRKTTTTAKNKLEISLLFWHQINNSVCCITFIQFWWIVFTFCLLDQTLLKHWNVILVKIKSTSTFQTNVKKKRTKKKKKMLSNKLHSNQWRNQQKYDYVYQMVYNEYIYTAMFNSKWTKRIAMLCITRSTNKHFLYFFIFIPCFQNSKWYKIEQLSYKYNQKPLTPMCN